MTPRLALLVWITVGGHIFASPDPCGTYGSKPGGEGGEVTCELRVTRTADAFDVGGSYQKRSGSASLFPPASFALRELLKPLVFEGAGRADAEGRLVGTFTDSWKNSGSFVITPSLTGAAISISVSSIANPESAALYQNLTLQRQ